MPVAGEAVRCEPEPDPPIPSDAAGAVARWSAERLKVPPGHPRAGEPMALPPFLEKFFREASAPGVRESGMFCGRKNSKSGGLGIWILAHLADDGPLRRRGWRCGAASLSREKAAELWTQIVDIAAASGLDEIRSGKVPRHVSSAWGRCEFLSADRTAGHASGFDLVIADELGLFPERGRDLVAGLLSSTSAHDGRLIAISVIGDSPLSREMIERAGDPATVAHVYQAAKDAALDDPAAWAAANPGLGSIKSRSYMADMARRAGANPAEAASFRVYDLNLPGSASREMIVTLDRWLLVGSAAAPGPRGAVFRRLRPGRLLEPDRGGALLAGGRAARGLRGCRRRSRPCGARRGRRRRRTLRADGRARRAADVAGAGDAVRSVPGLDRRSS